MSLNIKKIMISTSKDLFSSVNLGFLCIVHFLFTAPLIFAVLCPTQKIMITITAIISGLIFLSLCAMMCKRWLMVSQNDTSGSFFVYFKSMSSYFSSYLRFLLFTCWTAIKIVVVVSCTQTVAIIGYYYATGNSLPARFGSQFSFEAYTNTTAVIADVVAFLIMIFLATYSIFTVFRYLQNIFLFLPIMLDQKISFTDARNESYWILNRHKRLIIVPFIVIFFMRFFSGYLLIKFLPSMESIILPIILSFFSSLQFVYILFLMINIYLTLKYGDLKPKPESLDR